MTEVFVEQPLALPKSAKHLCNSFIKSKYLHFQTMRARDLKFLENVHHPCVSCVTCHASTLNSHFFCLKKEEEKVVEDKLWRREGGAVLRVDPIQYFN